MPKNLIKNIVLRTLINKNQLEFINRRMDNEMWYIFTMGFYSTVKKNEVMKSGG